MRVAVVGAGYVGLVTGVCLARLGHRVHCIDLDQEKIASISRGHAPIHEPGLDRLLKQCIGEGAFTAGTAFEEAIPTADIVLIAVNTPSSEDGSANLDFVRHAAGQIASSMSPGLIVAVKSTVPAGTARDVQALMSELRPGVAFSVASNPEFLREGSAIGDFMRPDRIVYGTDDAVARSTLRLLYGPLLARGVPVVETDLEGSELIKYASNAFLATKIAFINELSVLCERVGTHIDDVAGGMGLDHRIGKSFLDCGPGYGGSCFPKDVRALVAMGVRHGAMQRIAEQVDAANEGFKASISQRLLKLLGLPSAGKRVAILGLAFKPNTDDVREAVSLSVVKDLLAVGAEVSAHDYAVGRDAHPLFARVDWGETPYEAARNADALLVLTDWPEYGSLDMVRLAEAMRGKLLFDTRRILPVTEDTSQFIDLVRLGVAAGRLPASEIPPEAGRNNGGQEDTSWQRMSL